MENPIEMDDLGVPLFLETPSYTQVHLTWTWTIGTSHLPRHVFNAPTDAGTGRCWKKADRFEVNTKKQTGRSCKKYRYRMI